MKKQWYLYILECKDGTLYTGITDNVEKRLQAHSAGKGAKYTRGRSPLLLRYVEVCDDHSSALKREFQLKQMTKAQKILLCQSYNEGI